MKLIGQQHILQAITSYSLENLPKTILILGETGSEQETVANEVANHFGLDLVNISSKVEPEDLISYSQDPVSKFYIIHLNEFTEKQQNQFLKFIEEPSQTVYIILIAESVIGVLPTILNRCLKFTCAPYSETQLKECEWLVHNPNELVYKICKTPGQLADVDGDQIKSLYTLCEKIVNQIKKASYANALTLISKVNCDKDDNKFDFYQFFNTLEYVSFTKYLENKNIELYKIYMYVNKARQVYLNKKVNKESFMLRFLDGLWRLTH